MFATLLIVMPYEVEQYFYNLHIITT